MQGMQAESGSEVSSIKPQAFWVPGPIPGLNDLIDAAKGARGTGRIYAAKKRQWTNTIALLARAAKLQPVARARFAFCWREKKRNRDPDGISSGGRKLILDGLVTAGVLANDGWAQIAGWDDTFEVTDVPGVLVTIFPV